MPAHAARLRQLRTRPRHPRHLHSLQTIIVPAGNADRFKAVNDFVGEMRRPGFLAAAIVRSALVGIAVAGPWRQRAVFAAYRRKPANQLTATVIDEWEVAPAGKVLIKSVRDIEELLAIAAPAWLVAAIHGDVEAPGRDAIGATVGALRYSPITTNTTPPLPAGSLIGYAKIDYLLWHSVRTGIAWRAWTEPGPSIPTGMPCR